MGQRVCTFGVSQDMIDEAGWMLDGWLGDGDDEDQKQLTSLISLMQSMRNFNAPGIFHIIPSRNTRNMRQLKSN